MLKPIYDRVIVKPELTKPAGKLIMSLSGTSQTNIGEIVALGDNKNERGEELFIPLKVGDKIVYSSFGGTAINDGENELLIIRALDVLAII